MQISKLFSFLHIVQKNSGTIEIITVVEQQNYFEFDIKGLMANNSLLFL